MSGDLHQGVRLETGLTRTDILFPLVTLVVIAVASVMLFQRMFGAGGEGQTAVVGKIYYKDRVAERKFAKQALWSGLESGAPVYNYDTIRTETKRLVWIRIGPNLTHFSKSSLKNRHPAIGIR